MASSQTGDEHGVLGFSAGQLRQARGRRAPADVVYLFFTATTTHSATPTPTHTRPVHALQRRHPAIITEVLRRRVLGRAEIGTQVWRHSGSRTQLTCSCEICNTTVHVDGGDWHAGHLRSAAGYDLQRSSSVRATSPFSPFAKF